MHDAILDDLVYPTEIVGKRIRYRLDGSKVLKVGMPDVDNVVRIITMLVKCCSAKECFGLPHERPRRLRKQRHGCNGERVLSGGSWRCRA